MLLEPCSSCGRHVRANDERCPFCKATTPRTALTRAGMLLGAGAAILGCQTGTGDPNAPTRTANDPANSATAHPTNDTVAVPAYGLPPPMPTPSVIPTPPPTTPATATPIPTVPHTSVAVPAYGGPPRPRPPG